MFRFAESLLIQLQVKGLLADTGFSVLTISWTAAAAVLIGLLAWGIYQRRIAQRWRQAYERAFRVVEMIKPERGLENNLDDILEFFSQIVEAPVYAKYLYMPKNCCYVLKAVRHSTKDFGKVGPSYGGLAEYQKEEYRPPLSIEADPVSEQIRIDSDGEVPLLTILLGNAKGMIRIGPFKGKLTKPVRQALEEMAGLFGHGLDTIIRTEEMMEQGEIVVASGRAMQQIGQIARTRDLTLDYIIRLSFQTIHASGGCYIENKGGRHQIPVAVGLERQILEILQADGQTLGWLESLFYEKDYKLLKRGDPEFYQMPPYMAGIGMEALAVLQVDTGSRDFLLFWFERLSGEEEEMTALGTMRLIHENIQNIISQQLSLRQLSAAYSGILSGLVQLMDNLSPYTIGYSEMMSRYSIIIAKEMGLPEKEIRDVALAAYLSNIGMFGISADLYQKEGKFTEREFAMMKLHTEVGASIVRTTIGNENVAELILYHHERMDGNGYPVGLKRSEIPAGSRIIAVVQTFLAKINGRPYREPLPFHRALQTLRAAAGAQLDFEIVELFIGWFDRKQKSPQLKGRSLGACWEMCCVPKNVCEQCPAYLRTDVNCWEAEGNNCRAHGKACETCFVRTEYVYRSERT
ncbi:HD-GYP domain-containing protein [Ferviditalea candida]|uniref:HD domain-containing phosphohydrolase n=1 Tax=Ferviditalea candida TaxID=3108399 RepID=A0ABU5ZFU2_9BACL|nr:HD domain-containing phosphohydrolase [Paenibacillaceae bacterium T2]